MRRSSASVTIGVEPGKGTELVDTGGYLDPLGNNFWGVEAFKRGNRTIILGSDRDSGLWVFERTG